MNKTVCILILLGISFIEILFGQSVSDPDYNDLKFVGTLGLIQFFVSLYSSFRSGQKLLSPYVIFLIVMYVFHVGQALMYPFEIVSNRDLVGFLGITTYDILSGEIISLVFLSFFQIGALLCKNPKEKEPFSSIEVEKMDRRLKQIGFFLVIISVYFYYEDLLEQTVESLMNGYGAIYEGEDQIGLDNLGSVIGEYYNPGLLCLYIAYRNKRLIRNIIVSVLLLNCSFILVVGGRTAAVILGTLIVMMRYFLVKHFTKKEWLVIGGGAVCSLALLANIAGIRSNTDRDFSDTFIIDEEETGAEGVADAIGEMGGTMYCLIWTKQILDETGEYRYGSSYLYSFTTIIPNIDFWEIHPAVKYSNLGDWLTTEMNIDFGTGFSMVAEAYANFGYLGCLMMMFLGFCFAKILCPFESAVKQKNLAYIAFVLVLMFMILKIPRSSFIGIIRALFYYSLPVYWYTRGYIIKISKR